MSEIKGMGCLEWMPKADFDAMKARAENAEKEVERLREKLKRLSGYCMTVRFDRKKVVDDTVMCLQTEDWCNGLVEYTDAALKDEPTP